ncbi:putative methyltransferase [Saccharomonospora amisosensis]|uniref:Putative methyltransferase n=1 Tax=Saccharomonospora amisosensis TaxID=1128677 RepID=A0A7X5UMK1_9PSEU|nr:bis-aminopropyl spermidine synthase family protein [Saccharomonospora amisosensis]NIJ10789.1 putative methyltransferase [Saccharomonospora amisosensis]
MNPLRPRARPVRLVTALLNEGWRDIDELVHGSALPRRSVEELLAELGDDLEHRGDLVRLREGSAARAAELAGLPAEPPGDLLDRIRSHIEGVPAPLPALDHVQATPETVLRRARWLDEEYDLRQARLLFLGDHDLTSLAVRALRPDAGLTVVDVDDRVLEYLDDLSDSSIRTVHTDLRFGLPLAVAGSADVVFSDPPYTQAGMALFAARGVECLVRQRESRLLLAYGYSERHPTLGRQVQRELLSLGLTFEAIIPDFHRYTGAQAVGSAADLYVCQPTARASGKGARKGKAEQAIYTRGPRSVEANQAPRPLRDALAAIAAEGGRAVEQRDPDWTRPRAVSEGVAIAVDLTGDPGPWLLRVLLAVNADRVAALVPNAHPDLTNARAQAALIDLIEPKYRLRLLRSTPDNSHAVVVAEARPATEADSGVHAVWTRAHARLGNVWPRAGADIADLRLIDLPRHRIAGVRHQLDPR